MTRLPAAVLALAAALPARAAVVAPRAVPLSATAFSAPAALASPAAAAGLALPAFYAPALLAAPALAPSAAAPVAAAALPALRAAADAPSVPSAPGESKPESSPAPSPASPEKSAADAAASFDGAAKAPPAPVAEPALLPAAPAHGQGLVAADPADAEWLAKVVATLARSKTGRRVLRDIAALAEKRGHPTLVVVKAISNNGEFRYDSDLLVMDAAHRRAEPEGVAPIFAHELQHVLQRGMDLPVDALELEVESYTVESRVWTELGWEPAAGTFARDARKRLAEDLGGFLKWLGKQYKNNHILHGSTDASYREWLVSQRAKLDKRVAAAEKKLAKARRVVERMRAEGKPEEFVRAFIENDVEPVERHLRDLAVERGWSDRDLALLATPEGRARFRAYSRGVIRRARSLSR